MTQETKCKNCRFFQPALEAWQTSECRRRAPQVVIRYGSRNGEFPPAAADQWCGEFEPQPPAEQGPQVTARGLDRFGQIHEVTAPSYELAYALLQPLIAQAEDPSSLQSQASSGTDSHGSSLQDQSPDQKV